MVVLVEQRVQVPRSVGGPLFLVSAVGAGLFAGLLGGVARVACSGVASVRPLRGEEGNDGRYARGWELGDQLVDLGWVESFKGPDQ